MQRGLRAPHSHLSGLSGGSSPSVIRWGGALEKKIKQQRKGGTQQLAMHVCALLYAGASGHVCTRGYVCICTCVNTRVTVQVCASVYLQIHVHMSLCMRVHVSLCGTTCILI